VRVIVVYLIVHQVGVVVVQVKVVQVYLQVVYPQAVQVLLKEIKKRKEIIKMNNEQEMIKMDQHEKIDLAQEQILMEKDRLKTEVDNVLKDFLKVEAGNRVTIFNMEGLSAVLKAVFDSNTFYNPNDQGIL